MELLIKKADEEELLEKAFAIRREVFVDEQHVATEEEFDDYEEESQHFVALDTHHHPVGASRWRKTPKGIKLERFAVKKTVRGKGVGSALVAATLKNIAQHTNSGTYLYLHAQLDAVPLYEKFGFQKEGDLFDECNILHYLMWKKS